MTALRSLLFNVSTFSWTFLATLTLLLPAVLFAGPTRIRALGRLWSGVIYYLLKALCRIDYEVRGLENLPEGPCIIAAKHQSAWDTMIFLHLLEAPAYVLKRELTFFPIIGRALHRIGMISVDREGGSKALKQLVQDARARAAEGRKIIIFPEGTRVAPRESRPYHPGVAAIYRDLKVPAVPVGLNSGLYWGRRSFLKRPGRIVMEIGSPIPPGLARREFMARLEQQVEETTGRLVAQADARAAQPACG